MGAGETIAPHLIIKMEKQKYFLENEKKNFLIIMNRFLDGINFEQEQYQGRPRAYINDILKSLLIMSFHSWSYRRANSDIEQLYKEGSLNNIPKRSTLNKYMNNPEVEKIIGRLIQLSALSFSDVENTAVMDSTWYSKYIVVSGAHKTVHRTLKLPPFSKTRKLHVICLKESKIICWAKAGDGTTHDVNFFKDAITETVKNGFHIKVILADSAYNSRDNFSLCESLNIEWAFLDFKKNNTLKRSGSFLRRKMFKLYTDDKEQWHDFYRHRAPTIEGGIFSSFKRKNINYVRGRKPTAQNVELLLKSLRHNFVIIGKYYL